MRGVWSLTFLYDDTTHILSWLELPLMVFWLSLSPIPPRCEKVKTMEVTSVSIELEKNFSSFPRQYFALRKILKQLIGELFPGGNWYRACKGVEG